MTSPGAASRFVWWVIVVFGFVVAVVLFIFEYYLIGAIIGAFAVLRLLYTLSLPNRRGPSRLSPLNDPERALLWPLARDEFLIAAGVIGISGSQLRQDFNYGLSIAEVATRAGVALDLIIDAIVSDASTRLEQAVARGSVVSAEGNAAKSKLRPWAERLVNVHKRDLPSSRL